MKSSKIYNVINNSNTSHKQAFVCLQVKNPIVVWNVARGIIDSPYLIQKNFDYSIISFFLFSRYYKNDKAQFDLEMELEKVRSQKYPHKVSRLSGLFFFESEHEAETAYLLIPHFKNSRPTKVNIPLTAHYDKYDMNWITFYNDNYPDDWMDKYWQGQICTECPTGTEPNWECLTYESLIIVDKQLQEECVNEIQQRDDRTTMLLQLSIMGAYYGYLSGAAFFKYVPVGHHMHIEPMIYVPVEELVEIYKKTEKDFPENAKAIVQQSRKHLDIAFATPDFSKFSWCLSFKKSGLNCFNFSEEVIFASSFKSQYRL